MKIYKTIILALCAFFLFACAQSQPEQPKTPTPTDTLKTFIEATKNKDIETVKRTLSKGTMAIIEDSAKKQNTTVDELLRKDNGMPVKELPEMRDEKIEGETASVEVKNVVTGDFDRVPFVKEEGVWKIALDVFMQDLMRKMQDQMKNLPAESNAASNSAKSGDKNGKSPKETTNKK